MIFFEKNLRNYVDFLYLFCYQERFAVFCFRIECKIVNGLRWGFEMRFFIYPGRVCVKTWTICSERKEGCRKKQKVKIPKGVWVLMEGVKVSWSFLNENSSQHLSNFDHFSTGTTHFQNLKPMFLSSLLFQFSFSLFFFLFLLLFFLFYLLIRNSSLWNENVLFNKLHQLHFQTLFSALLWLCLHATRSGNWTSV